jgi:NAD dependent epimerase/dehydratase family enzyme
MVVLVTGATGRLGQVVVGRLLAEGRAVRILTRRPFLAQRLFAGKVEIHEWHPQSEPLPAEALQDVGGVIHLMGAPFSGGHPRGRAELAVQSRIEATGKLIAAIRGRRIRLVMTTLPLPAGSKHDPAASPPSMQMALGASVPTGADAHPWELEAYAADAAAESIAIVRLGLLASPGEPLHSLVAMARWGVVPGLAAASIPAIDPADAAAMLSGLLDQPDLIGDFEGVAPTSVEGAVVAAALAKGAPIMIPESLMRVAGRIGEVAMAKRLGPLAALFSLREAPRPIRLLEAGASFDTPDPTQMLIEAIEALIAERGPVFRLPGAAGAWSRRKIVEPTASSAEMAQASASRAAEPIGGDSGPGAGEPAAPLPEPAPTDQTQQHRPPPLDRPKDDV